VSNSDFVSAPIMQPDFCCNAPYCYFRPIFFKLQDNNRSGLLHQISAMGRIHEDKPAAMVSRIMQELNI
jgi:hypothetical protein